MGAYIDERLAALAAYVPGEQPQDREYIKLNANESPFPPSPGVIRAVSEAAAGLNMYPDAACRELKAALAARYGVESANVMVEDGSDNILNLCFMGFCGRGVAYPAVSYGFYSVFSALYGLDALEVPMGPGLTIEPERFLRLGRTVVIANPNAQTGIALSLEDMERIIKSNPNNVVIVDEAYVDFGAESCLPLIDKYDNLLIVRTMSKSGALAGARIGYCVGNKELIADIKTIKYSFNPYNVGTMAQAAGEAAARDKAYYAKKTGEVIKNRSALCRGLDALGMEYLPSKSNFVLAKKAGMSGEELYLKLKDKGVLVRHFGGRIADYIRITVGSGEEIGTLLACLKEIL